MKKTLIVFGILVLAAACKKKKSDPEPLPPSTPVAPLISVKIDGTQKQCNSCYSGSYSGGMRGSYFYLDGFNEEIYFSCNALPAIGTYTLSKYGEPLMIYIKNNSYRPASTGTLNIASIDTSKTGVINKLVATFSFKTDTSSAGVSFNITEGSFNLK